MHTFISNRRDMPESTYIWAEDNERRTHPNYGLIKVHICAVAYIYISICPFLIGPACLIGHTDKCTIACFTLTSPAFGRNQSTCNQLNHHAFNCIWRIFEDDTYLTNTRSLLHATFSNWADLQCTIPVSLPSYACRSIDPCSSLHVALVGAIICTNLKNLVSDHDYFLNVENTVTSCTANKTHIWHVGPWGSQYMAHTFSEVHTSIYQVPVTRCANDSCVIWRVIWDCTMNVIWQRTYLRTGCSAESNTHAIVKRLHFRVVGALEHLILHSEQLSGLAGFYNALGLLKRSLNISHNCPVWKSHQNSTLCQSSCLI